MFIMGSTTVYSKKVDFVYNLATSFFDLLKDKPTNRRRGGEDDDEDGDGGEEDEETANRRKQERRKQTLAGIRNLVQKLEKHPRPTLPIVPIAFTPLAEFEKVNVPLYSRLDPTEIVGKKDDFKVNTFHIYQVRLYGSVIVIISD